jgi:hypothetical protein
MPQDRLSQAVEALAVSADPIQQRLARAGLVLSPLHIEEFEPEDRREFEAVRAALSTIVPGDGGSAIEATTAAMSDEDALAIARRLVALDVIYRPLYQPLS